MCPKCRLLSGLAACFLAAFLLAIAPKPTRQSSRPWPVVEPIAVRRHLIFREGKDIPISVKVMNKNGEPEYLIECHTGYYTDNRQGFQYSGAFQCAMFSLSDNRVSSGDLLAANSKNERSTDWWNRGRLLSWQLSGECLRFPEYSTSRHFKLRGMLVTISFSDPEWAAQTDNEGNRLLTSVNLAITVQRDPAANTMRPLVPNGPLPPASCYP